MTIQESKAIPVPEVAPRTPIPPQNLRIPGPTTVPPEVLAEITHPMINHRGPEFAEIMHRVSARLQYFFQTTSPVLTYASSGTGGQESSVANLFSPGDHVVVISIGAFGNRFAKIAETYGLNVTRIDFPWGQAADPQVVADRLKTLAPFKGILVTHNETSTGVTNDIEALARAIRGVAPETLIAVDAVSSLGCVPLEMDAWDIDVVFTGSQKGWMTPPGLMMIAPRPRALAASKTARLPRFYFDWANTLNRYEAGQHPSTPPVSLFYAIDLALDKMLAEGREAIFARHRRVANYVRWRAKAMGLRLLADHVDASNTVTAVLMPEGIDAKALIEVLREQDHVIFGGGQEHLAGRIIRIGHMGYFEEIELVEAMDALEKRLRGFGFQGK